MGLDPKIKRVVILGSGPIVIGQACEFDYSGTQACKALMSLGLEVILINSNPATIMTDPEIATRTYVEPLNPTFVLRILEKEKPDAIIPTLGGQTALNLALDLFDSGDLERLNIQLLGARPEVIRAGEDRETFRAILDEIGAGYPKSFMVRTFEHGKSVGRELGYPIILRPNYTLGGGGGGIAYSEEEYQQMLIQALNESPTSEVLVEESILGWKEYELEVMRDRADTFVVVCSIENFDPCGVHTGDSITVAPQQTLSDREYQDMRDEAYKIISRVGIETGGANIQFAVHPKTGERVVIEMNPRVSRSSALASKATGFPIAKLAALLAVGFELSEIKNDITGSTPSCYEPALDYIVTKIPRFAFEKFPGAKDSLTTQMKSVGEVMGIGRTFKESFMKALSSLELNEHPFPEVSFSQDLLSYPSSTRLFHIAQGFREGMTVADIEELTSIHPWFLEQVEDLICVEKQIVQTDKLDKSSMLNWKRNGFPDATIANLLSTDEPAISDFRAKHGILPAFEMVDTCAAEFDSSTPYYYSTYWGQRKRPETEGEVVAILGSGPNRIGQGIEFDYSCVRGVQRFQALGYKALMVNCNPETVSTDYDTSDILFFEPLTAEHVSEVFNYIGVKGFVAQLGGQTPINIAEDLVGRGHELLGSTLSTIDRAEDRKKFTEVCRELDVRFPKAGMAANEEQALKIAEEIGFPVICRPSYVLGGRRMEVVENTTELSDYFTRHAVAISEKRPCMMDQFLQGALEVDVDLVRGVDWLLVGGIVEHIEAAGIHSGDSMGVLPPQRLKPATSEKIEKMSQILAEKLDVIGFLNIQLAIKNDEVYMLEANPRSSRSVPFIAKATNIPIVDLGIEAMLGRTRDQVEPERYNWKDNKVVSVKGVVFPFKKFSEADSILGPEMKSTGECMGRGEDYAEALLKAMVSCQIKFPEAGEVFLSLREKDKPTLLPMASALIDMGFHLVATKGTCDYLVKQGLDCELIKKVHEGRPHCVDRIRSGTVTLVINTTSGRQSIEASFGIRRSCLDYSVPCLTESGVAEAFLLALKKQRQKDFSVAPLR